MNPWVWAVGSLVVAYAELHCPGCYLIWIAAGGAVAALASFMFDVSLTTQIVIFVLSCSVTCVFGNLVYRRFVPFTQHGLNQRNVDIVGARGIVAVSIQNGRGKVKLGDTVWLAEGPNLQEGTPVMVTGMRGTVPRRFDQKFAFAADDDDAPASRSGGLSGRGRSGHGGKITAAIDVCQRAKYPLPAKADARGGLPA